MHARRAIALWSVAAMVLASLLFTGTTLVSAAPSGAVLGDDAIEPVNDASPQGTAEANQFTATAAATVSSLWIYVDATDQATSIGLALYADAAGVPGGLIAQGSTSAVQRGAWNTVAITPTALAAATPYWIARLSLAGGELVTRVDPAAANPDRTDTRTLTGFPASWSAGESWPHRTSMYAAGAAAPTPTPSATAAPTPTPSASPTPTPTASPTPTPTASPAPTPTPTAPPTPSPSPSPSQTTVTFDDLASPDRALDGVYAGIDWGSGAWYLSGPWGLFATNSISYPAAGPTSAAFAFVAPHVLLSVTAYNGGSAPSTISLACAGNPSAGLTLAPGSRAVINTGWTATCTTVTVGSTNGWDT
ncbi:MAG TPA: hypothetical protein VEU77_10095, partial [Candidatus Acidoferrales bacterium]|nr:hypothetical protein [Candidatus Acidoferrales bacterium]